MVGAFQQSRLLREMQNRSAVTAGPDVVRITTDGAKIRRRAGLLRRPNAAIIVPERSAKTGHPHVVRRPAWTSPGFVDTPSSARMREE